MSSGLDKLLLNPPSHIRGARLGLLGHAASVTLDGTPAAEAVAAHPSLNLQVLLGPEHGYFSRAAAGEDVDHGHHPTLGIPIHSLYGEHRTPPADWLTGLDALLIDFQDLGVRCYTYASTLDNVLGTCARIGLPVVILDRLPPLHGVVDGPRLDPALRSFVGQVDLPFVFGKSSGELARWLHTHAYPDLKLDILQDDGGARPWPPPSPAIVSAASACLYPVTVWCEAIPGVSVERGGPRSFQVWGMEDLDPARLIHELSLPGLSLFSDSCILAERKIPAVGMSVTGPFRPAEAAVRLLCALRDQLGAARLFDADGARPAFFDQLWGSSIIRTGLQNGDSAERILSRPEWTAPSI